MLIIVLKVYILDLFFWNSTEILQKTGDSFVEFFLSIDILHTIGILEEQADIWCSTKEFSLVKRVWPISEGYVIAGDASLLLC